MVKFKSKQIARPVGRVELREKQQAAGLDHAGAESGARGGTDLLSDIPGDVDEGLVQAIGVVGGVVQATALRSGIAQERMVDGEADGVGDHIVFCRLPVQIIDVRAQVHLVHGLGHVVEIVAAVGAVVTAALAVVGTAVTTRAVAVVVLQATAAGDVVVVVGLAVGQQDNEILLAPVADGRCSRDTAGERRGVMKDRVIVLGLCCAIRVQGKGAIVLAVDCAGALLVARVGGSRKAHKVAADVVQGFCQRGPVAGREAVDGAFDGCFVGGEIGNLVVKLGTRFPIEAGHPYPHVVERIQQLDGSLLRRLHAVDCDGLAGSPRAEGVTAVIGAKIPVEIVAAVIPRMTCQVGVVACSRVKAVLRIRAVVIKVTPFAPAAPTQAWRVPVELGIAVRWLVPGIQPADAAGRQQARGRTGVSGIGVIGRGRGDGAHRARVIQQQHDVGRGGGGDKKRGLRRCGRAGASG